MHVLPRVRELEERYADTLTVIGVHSGKFTTERVTERIAEACDRLGVVHAVVNDRQFRVWRDYAVEAWPTIVVIDPEGYIAFVAPGETPVDVLGGGIERVIERAEVRGTLVRGTDPTSPRLARHEGGLSFPTRAILDCGRLWVSDTGHGRVLECAWDPAGRTAKIEVEHPGFVEPRGLAALSGRMYVADRGGHAVWLVGGGDGVRAAGTGVIGDGAIRAGRADRTDLRSPWGLSTSGGRLAIAMAGTHQIWTLDPGSGDLALLAGTGAEDIADGGPVRAALAQPTGLSSAPGTGLALADCETSAVRLVSADSVDTLVGTGLFEFGDRDGAGEAALLQHCEDVAWHGGALAVADTYNDRLKRSTPQTSRAACEPARRGRGEAARCATRRCWSDGSTLLVADTGHHRVVAVESDGAVSEIRFA